MEKKTLEFKFERTTLAPVAEVFDAWLNPKIPGNPWNAAEKFILDPKVDGLLLDPQWDLPLRPVHCGRSAGSDSTYVGIAENSGSGIDSDRDLHEKGRRDADDPRAFRPSGS